MLQPEGLQPELAKLSRAARQYVLELGVQCAEQQAEIERLMREWDGVSVSVCSRCGKKVFTIQNNVVCQCGGEVMRE